MDGRIGSTGSDPPWGVFLYTARVRVKNVLHSLPLKVFVVFPVEVSTAYVVFPFH